MSASLTFDELAAAATIGLNNKPTLIERLSGPAGAHDAVIDSDPAAAVLDAAALFTAARDGGVQAGPGRPSLAEAAADTRPELPVGAGEILSWALGADTGLLLDLLRDAGRAGYRLTPAQLPRLLDTVSRNRVLIEAAGPVLGERGRWLAQFRPAWAATVPPPTDPDPTVWEHGLPIERLSYLTGLRQRDPQGARELLVEGFSREAGEHRAELLGVLRHGLSEEDETFLDAALSDRKAEVRAVAAGLLSRLPQSAFIHRAIARVEGLVRLERKALRRRLIVTLPPALDESAIRDGVVERPSHLKLGEGAWRLVQLVGAVPLSHWVNTFDLPVDTILDLPIEGFGTELRAGWRLAARRQSDPTWARLLLMAGRPAQESASWFTSDAVLAQQLDPAERERRVRNLLERKQYQPAAAEVEWCTGPWTDDLTGAVLSHLERGVRKQREQQHNDHVFTRTLARCLPVRSSRSWVAELDRIRVVASAVDVPRFWPGALATTAEIVHRRTRFYEEIS